MKGLVLAALLLACASLAVAGEKLHSYKATGHNRATKERVLGQFKEVDKEGYLQGKIWDRQFVIHVNATWQGKGIIQAVTQNGTTYRLKTVED